MNILIWWLITDCNGVLKLKSEVDAMRKRELIEEKRLEAKFLGVDLSELDAEALRASLEAGQVGTYVVQAR